MSENLTPVFRLEHFIKAAADGTPCELTPVFNEEKYLHKIAGGSVDKLPRPVGRFQEYLANIAGMDVEAPKPVFREEFYLAALAGMDVEVPYPFFRLEFFLADWVQSGGGGGSVTLTVTGVSPLALVNAIAHNIESLTQYGKCVQASTPTPSAPVDIACNNGAIKFGWHDIITTSALSGYGTYVTPTNVAGNRAYKWFKDLPNGTYRFSVEGDYEILVQWRDPADPSMPYPTPTPTPAPYENLTGWMTSGVVTLDKPTGGYGIAVRRTSGTDSITPSNFDGVLHVAERGLYVVGTSEVLTLLPIGSASQAGTPTPEAPVPVVGTPCGDTILYALGDVKDTYDPATQTITRRVGSYAFKGTENLGTSTAYGASINLTRTNQGWGADREVTPLCNYFKGETKATGQKPIDTCFFNGSGHFYFRTNSPLADFKTWLAELYAAGNPVTVYFALETPTTEAYTGTPVGEVVNDVPMLLSVGDTKDEAEIISGIKTGKVGVKVFDGTETVNVSSAGNAYIAIDGVAIGAPNTPINTHFALETSTTSLAEGRARFGANGSTIYSSNYYMSHPTARTAAAFKAWLASEYANGTPVIVLYPLAEETTEQTTPHSLHTVKGDNVVSLTANVSPIQLEAVYKGAVTE